MQASLLVTAPTPGPDRNYREEVSYVVVPRKAEAQKIIVCGVVFAPLRSYLRQTSIQPAINSGNLTYGPAAYASGTATIFFAQDNGGTANGGVDSSPSQSFTITATPVNDAPFHDVPFITSTFQQTPLVFSGLHQDRRTLTDWATDLHG